MNITKERVEELIKTIQLVAACSPAFMFPQKDYADLLAVLKDYAERSGGEE